MNDDRSNELADQIADKLTDFEIKEQFNAKYDDYHGDYWGAKLLVQHSDGSTYEVVITQINDIYSSEFGDEKECVCGHIYYRHFDSYHSMDPVGCKYCQCEKFIMKDKS